MLRDFWNVENTVSAVHIPGKTGVQRLEVKMS